MKNEIPEVIDKQIITALNNLFSELKEVKISTEDIKELLFKEQGVMNYDMFASKLDEVKDWVLEKGDRDNIRIKIIENKGGNIDNE